MRPQLLTAKLYFSLCSLLEHMTSQSLRESWFVGLVLNLPLWSRSAFETLSRVLRHWARVIPVKFPDECGCLSVSFLVGQFLRFFCPTGHQVVLPFKPFVNSSESDINHCGDHFHVVVARLARVNLRESDISAIATHIDECRDKSTLFKFFRLIHDMSDSISDIPKFDIFI
jgi:hypothetical protein